MNDEYCAENNSTWCKYEIRKKETKIKRTKYNMENLCVSVIFEFIEYLCFGESTHMAACFSYILLFIQNTCCYHCWLRFFCVPITRKEFSFFCDISFMLHGMGAMLVIFLVVFFHGDVRPPGYVFTCALLLAVDLLVLWWFFFIHRFVMWQYVYIICTMYVSRDTQKTKPE